VSLSANYFTSAPGDPIYVGPYYCVLLLTTGSLFPLPNVYGVALSHDVRLCFSADRTSRFG